MSDPDPARARPVICAVGEVVRVRSLPVTAGMPRDKGLLALLCGMAGSMVKSELLQRGGP